jgi:hypothetical protein
MVYLKIFNNLGKLVLTQEFFQDAGVNSHQIDVSQFPVGTYYFSLNTGNLQAGRFVKQ